MPSIFLQPGENLPYLFTVVATLVTGRVVVYLLYPWSLAGEDVLSSKGVALISSMVMYGLVTSTLHLMRMFLMVLSASQ